MNKGKDVFIPIGLLIVTTIALVVLVSCNKQISNEEPKLIIYCNYTSIKDIPREVSFANLMVSCAMVQAEPMKYNQSFYNSDVCMIFNDISVGRCD